MINTNEVLKNIIKEADREYKRAILKLILTLIGHIGGDVFFIFCILKLTNVLTWSWWWVTSPIWIAVILSIIILVVYMLKRKLR